MPLVAKRADTSSWSADRKLTVRVRARDRASHDEDVDASENASSGGAADTEMTEVAVKPDPALAVAQRDDRDARGVLAEDLLVLLRRELRLVLVPEQAVQGVQRLGGHARASVELGAGRRGDLGAQGAATLRPPAFDHGVRVGELRLDEGQRPRGHDGAELDEQGPQVHLADERVRGVARDDDAGPRPRR